MIQLDMSTSHILQSVFTRRSSVYAIQGKFEFLPTFQGWKNIQITHCVASHYKVDIIYQVLFSFFLCFFTQGCEID